MQDCESTRLVVHPERVIWCQQNIPNSKLIISREWPVVINETMEFPYVVDFASEEDRVLFELSASPVDCRIATEAEYRIWLSRPIE